MSKPLAAAVDRIAIIREFFARSDAGREDLFDLMVDDVEFYFPKFGFGRGKAELKACARGVGATLRSISHVQDALHFIEAPNELVVEGLSNGETATGQKWVGGQTPTGRFCGVYRFRGNLISSLHTYLDPDYGSADKDRFLWGREGRRW
jgi:ketosteroid isomerase-like protein